MSGYLVPVDAPVSASWQDHKDRNPPSSEPGTDLACAYGSPILCAGEGTVADYSRSTNGGTGRYLTIDLDDGRRIRYLHLHDTWLERGQRVSRGWVIATSGASGWGSDWGYGAHVHVTLFPGHWYDFDRTLDFMLHVAAPDPVPVPIPPPPPPFEGANMFLMRTDVNPSQFILVSVDGGQFRARFLEDPYERSVVLAAVPALPVAVCDTATFDGFLTRIGYAYGHPIPLLDVNAATQAPPSSSSPLVRPAWLVGFLLGLIGLVEVIRLVVDLLT